MICKQCGYNTGKAERFCPNCGSYFIDASSPDSSAWKGIVMSDGTMKTSMSSYEVNNRRVSASSLPLKKKVWGIIEMASAGWLLMINLIALAESSALAAGVFIFIFSIVACSISSGTKFSRIALGILLAALIVFIKALMS